MAAAARALVFDLHFLEDLEFWVTTDRKTALKVIALVVAIHRDPFTGIGKPAALRHIGAGLWSRRITKFAQARYHY